MRTWMPVQSRRMASQRNSTMPSSDSEGRGVDVPPDGINDEATTEEPQRAPPPRTAATAAHTAQAAQPTATPGTAVWYRGSRTLSATVALRTTAGDCFRRISGPRTCMMCALSTSWGNKARGHGEQQQASPA